MIGDLTLWLREIRARVTYGLKRRCRQLACIHVYVGRKTPARAYTWRECVHCGRTRDWESWC